MRVIEKKIITALSEGVRDPDSIKRRVLSRSEYAGWDPRDIIETVEDGFRYRLFSTMLFSYNKLDKTARILLSSCSATTVSRVKALLRLFFGEDVSRKNSVYMAGGMRLEGTAVTFKDVHSIAGSNMLGFTDVLIY